MLFTSIFSFFHNVFTLSMSLTLSETTPGFYMSAVENTVGKGEIARHEQFLRFPVFSTSMENFLPFQLNLKLMSTSSFSLEESKICRLGKG